MTWLAVSLLLSFGALSAPAQPPAANIASIETASTARIAASIIAASLGVSS